MDLIEKYEMNKMDVLFCQLIRMSRGKGGKLSEACVFVF